MGGNGGFAVSKPLPVDLEAKTLEAWVRLKDLQQRGGGVLGVQTRDGSVFDSIVFGEKEPGRWMAGSENFRRTASFGGPVESEAAERIVHVAIVYHADGTITGYRDGRPYGKPYRSKAPVRFAKGESQIVFGLRHSPVGGNRLLAGAIAGAQVYDRALTAEAVAASAATAPSFVSPAELAASLTEQERTTRQRLTAQIAAISQRREQLKPLSNLHRGAANARRFACFTAGQSRCER